MISGIGHLVLDNHFAEQKDFKCQRNRRSVTFYLLEMPMQLHP